jgi:hypothetical protein
MSNEVPEQVPVQYPQPVSAKAHIADRKPEVKQSRDRAQYVRQQKGHSLTLHLLLGVLVLWVNVIYISVSPNHYWHA